MKKIVLKYWWILPLLLIVFMLGLALLFSTDPTVFEGIVGVLLLLVILLLPVSWVVLLINKKWWQGLLSFGLSILIVILLWMPLVMGAMMGPDGFGRKHPIPDGLEFNIPLDPDSGKVVSIDSLDIETYLQVWSEFQGGIYNYDFYYPALPAGEVFLRCYEVSQNIPLSEDRLPERSTVSVGATSSFSRIVTQKEFKIYEGDWDDYYAARIEVWFRDAESKQEKKLCEKVYRVEGWMR